MKSKPRTPAPAVGKIKFARRIEFDELSRDFPVRRLLRGEPRKPRSYTWRCLSHLNQGSEGSCVGHAWAHELIARPDEFREVGSPEAKLIYRTAQKLDQWAGENYEGTSVLGGIKAVQKIYPHRIEEYRWAFGLDDVLRTLSYLGPVVLGVNWYDSMMEPDEKGLIKITGKPVGGHAILCRGVSVAQKVVRLHNSWGDSWGAAGDCFLSFADLDRLLKEDGEACIPVTRRGK
jgi:hypothetical protein